MSDENQPQQIAVARDYPGLRAALIARRHALGWSQLEVDHRAGFYDAYCGKLEIGTRNFGDMSLGALLGALGLELVIRTRHPRVHMRHGST